ncbi:MAG TPA: hypothetical protein VKB69_02420, partial [Micromonosporaceae bacterium]|nr:hypothetical protein [Micromonosporaceae bacterium]
MSNPVVTAPLVQNTDAVVRLTLDLDDPLKVKVASISVSGRPAPHPFQGGEGRHTTAWAVYADTVRRAMVGEDINTAVIMLNQLVADENSYGTAGL